MTRYTVVWHFDAEDQLLRLWLAAADRQSITTAANSIDSELAREPEIKGVIVDDDFRELTVPPLRVLFSVSEPDRQVRIVGIALV